MRFKAGLTSTPNQIAVVDEEGKVGRGINWMLTDEELSQVKQGYRCLNCMEPFEQAFPEKCNVCGFLVRENQSFELLRQHQGEIDSETDQWKQLDEQREREAFKPRSGIWVPGQ